MVVLSVLAVSACLFIPGYMKCARVMSHVVSLREHLRGLEAIGTADLLSNLQGGELEATRDELVQAGDDMRGLKAELGPALALTPYLGWLPVVGGDASPLHPHK